MTGPVFCGIFSISKVSKVIFDIQEANPMENLKSLFIQAIDNTIEEQLLTAQNFLKIQSGDVSPLVELQLEQTKEQLADIMVQIITEQMA